MDIEQLRTYCLSKPKVTNSFPFDESTLVFKVLGKMFALVPLEKWERGLASINLKCDPEYAINLREAHESIVPGWHSNKKHWNTVYIHKADLKPEFIKQLIDHSYDMVIKGMTKKIRLELES
ncbi:MULTISPECIES: MmcQ/YjbR family DNA-binding protein [unclassified Olleya]|jgi:predicted DNA-binding protein (MmcQ/YjbR family)|uniref:MmcQ/YjbR family DNA-binding protein n=1 Tax=unclassified Olleya TaxID=2615019 RepID=UPI0011A2C4BC|nr:MmcQ/YjbR family DNA-binding protein [Olleya sp. Hel_I_94]TVZ47748.1 putative DNA-binding protein (MmcQ/YjbR family) [Olleya sp. Hel_I_94]